MVHQIIKEGDYSLSCNVWRTVLENVCEILTYLKSYDEESDCDELIISCGPHVFMPIENSVKIDILLEKLLQMTRIFTSVLSRVSDSPLMSLGSSFHSKEAMES